MAKKILVVDDEREVVDFLESFLNRFDLTIFKATGGNEAVILFDEHKPDCVFLDIQMPERDGFSVLKELMEKDSSAKVIMITAKEDKDFQVKAKKYGALDYITKPLDLFELNKKIEEYILP